MPADFCFANGLFSTASLTAVQHLARQKLNFVGRIQASSELPPSLQPMADLRSELERLRVENARLKEELKLYSGVENLSVSSADSIGKGEDGGGNACPAPSWTPGVNHNLTAAQIQRV